MAAEQATVASDPATATTETQAVSETNKEESTSRTRSRRSPRHIRAAGQKRRKEGDDKEATAQAETPAVTQDELQFDAPVAAPKVQAVPEVEVAVTAEKPEQVAMELTTEPVQVADTAAPTATASAEPSKVTAPEPEKAVVAEPVKQAPVKQAPVKEAAPKATPLKVAKPAKKASVSAPMARPATIDTAFVEVKIGSLDDAARPEVKRSSKAAAFSSTSNAVTAPATRPGSPSE